MNAWKLPRWAEIGGVTYPIRADYRDVLTVIRTLEDPELPELFRWQVALELFYEGRIPRKDQQQAMRYMADFIACGQEQTEEKDPPRLLDWEQDAPTIVADINKVAGCEIRALPFLHWWSFVAYFHGIGEGQLSTIVSIRNKLRRGTPLEKWEKEFYRENRERVNLKKRYSAEELAEQKRLKKLLGE